MFEMFKNFFGMDTVKLRLDVMETYPKDVKTVNGDVELRSAAAIQVDDLQIRLVEVYTRGRGDDKRIDEYLLGTWQAACSINVPPSQPVAIRFELDFEFEKSKIDALGDKNFLFRGVAGLAKSLKGVQSDYYLIAEATVRGGKLKPFAKAKIKFA